MSLEITIATGTRNLQREELRSNLHLITRNFPRRNCVCCIFNRPTLLKMYPSQKALSFLRSDISVVIVGNLMYLMCGKCQSLDTIAFNTSLNSSDKCATISRITTLPVGPSQAGVKILIIKEQR